MAATHEPTAQDFTTMLIKNFSLLEVSYSRSADACRLAADFAGRKGDGRSRPKVARLLREAAENEAKAAKCRAEADKLARGEG